MLAETRLPVLAIGSIIVVRRVGPVCGPFADSVGPHFSQTREAWRRQQLRGRKRLACRPILATPFDSSESDGVCVLPPTKRMGLVVSGSQQASRLWLRALVQHRSL